PPWRRLPFFTALSEALGTPVDPGTPLADLAAAAARPGGTAGPKAAPLGGGQAVFDARIEPGLVQPTFVTDFPIVLSPLSKRKREDPRLVDRVALFLTRPGIAN